MRVLACGNRDFSDRYIMELVFYGLDEKSSSDRQTFHVIHGDCRGADKLFASVAEGSWACIDAYPADWDKIGKAAGFARNQQMLFEGQPDLVLAFIDKPLAECKGTSHMVELAKTAGVPTYVIEKVA